MKLFILRHAIAAERSSQYKDDSLRPLTNKGRTLMRQNAKGMKALGLSFDVVISSPYLRAKETAHIVIDVLKKPSSIVLSKNLIPSISFERLLKEINTSANRSKNILIVGHEPHLSRFIAFLLTGSFPLSIDFKKGGLCQLIFDGPALPKHAVLSWMLTPSILRRIH